MSTYPAQRCLRNKQLVENIAALALRQPTPISTLVPTIARNYWRCLAACPGRLPRAMFNQAACPGSVPCTLWGLVQPCWPLLAAWPGRLPLTCPRVVQPGSMPWLSHPYACISLGGGLAPGGRVWDDLGCDQLVQLAQEHLRRVHFLPRINPNAHLALTKAQQPPPVGGQQAGGPGPQSLPGAGA